MSTSRLTFIKNTHLGYKAKALYKCQCGSIKEININNVKSGNTLSCGCLQKENRYNRVYNVKHDMSSCGLNPHPLYKVWSGIKSRCYNSNTKAYKSYGGKGVQMCKQWKDNFIDFYNWAIANGWCKGLSIDKDIKPFSMGLLPIIYSPEMCSIVTAKENGTVRSDTVMVRHKGEVISLSILAKKTGIRYSRLRYHYDRGIDDLDKYISKYGNY